MNFLRFISVALIVTLCGGIFGAAVGGLIGYAVPTSLHAFFGVSKAEAAADDKDRSSTKIEAGLGEGKNLWTQGAALGAAWGLVLGSFFGLIIAVADQVMITVRTWTKEIIQGKDPPPTSKAA